MERRAFEVAEDPDWYVGNYEFQVPIFVLTHRRPRVKPGSRPMGPDQALQIDFGSV
jgi:hypothetical protein